MDTSKRRLSPAHSFLVPHVFASFPDWLHKPYKVCRGLIYRGVCSRDERDRSHLRAMMVLRSIYTDRVALL